MGTLWSELGPVADTVTDRPRVYADANVPAGIVAYMRDKLRWDVLFVMDHPDLRRARDAEHFRLARGKGRLHRKLCPRQVQCFFVILAHGERATLRNIRHCTNQRHPDARFLWLLQLAIHYEQKYERE